MDREPGKQDPPGSIEPATPSASGGGMAAYAGLGFQFAIAILLGLYVGQWVDRKLGTRPLFLIIGVFAGAAAGFYSMIQRSRADEKREDRSPPR
jgi:F0F1-type ATP synthase assembly protein I